MLSKSFQAPFNPPTHLFQVLVRHALVGYGIFEQTEITRPSFGGFQISFQLFGFFVTLSFAHFFHGRGCVSDAIQNGFAALFSQSFHLFLALGLFRRLVGLVILL